ncbi:MAG: glutamyl-tRNA reductase [Candidatus Bathyarchaeota archaeon]|nr:glutamyl-tRNA reductase [Candidatus Bathyarchaeota archaeon]
MWSVYPTMHCSAKSVNIINVRVTHKTANVPLLEAVACKDKQRALSELFSLEAVDECVLLQTCNRVEVYLVSADAQVVSKLVAQYLVDRAGAVADKASSAIELSLNHDALGHILRVTSGLESMVIGEDQVINQVWNAYVEAEEAKAVGPVLKHLFFRAVNVGRRVRNETGINKGAVSVGAAAVELARSLLENFAEKKILVLGAGETGTLVAKAMARRCLSPIVISNRTYARAIRIAEELNGKAVNLARLGEVLVDADVVICATAAPHYLLTKAALTKHLENRQNPSDLLVIDISNPRNVEACVGDLGNVRLYNIDDLQSIAQRNLEGRQQSVQAALDIIGEELDVLERALKTESVRDIISDLLSQTEQVRQRELLKALALIGDPNEREKKIINDLTSIVLKQTFVPLIENLRLAAMNNDAQVVEAAIKLFSTNHNHTT